MNNGDIKFYGYDILKYYWYVLQNEYADYPWQIYIAWLIVILSIFTLFILAVKFFIQYRKTNKFNRKLKKVYEKYYDKIKNILLCDYAISEHEIISILGNNYEDYIKTPKLFIPIITDIHMELNSSYFPNMNTLCNILNITNYCENNLLKEKNVFKTLQFICINNIVIMEGRLANYVNHKDRGIRMIARLCYIFCSYNTPYKYIEDELKDFSEMKFMFMHFIFEWMKYNKKPLPDFDDLIEKFKDSKDVCDFLENERIIL